MAKYTFSGHESFQCKGLWLKKGYDFVVNGGNFNDATAVIDLGVGKNMVGSIKYWMRSFGILSDEGELSDFAHYIFDDENGRDRYMEDTATLWLLHYMLISTNHATLYKETCVEFHSIRNEFEKKHILSFLKRQFADKKFEGAVYNENTLSKDIDTLIKNYVEPRGNKNYEDYSTLLIELQYIVNTGSGFSFNYASKTAVPAEVFFAALLFEVGNVSVVDYSKIIELSLMFNLTTQNHLEIFDKLNKVDNNIIFDNSAGEQSFKLNEQFTPYQVLDWYYTR